MISGLISESMRQWTLRISDSVENKLGNKKANGDPLFTIQVVKK